MSDKAKHCEDYDLPLKKRQAIDEFKQRVKTDWHFIAVTYLICCQWDVNKAVQLYIDES